MSMKLGLGLNTKLLSIFSSIFQVISYHSLKDVFKLAETVSIEIIIHVNIELKGINECISSTVVVGGYNSAMMCHQSRYWRTGEEDTL